MSRGQTEDGFAPSTRQKWMTRLERFPQPKRLLLWQRVCHILRQTQLRRLKINTLNHLRYLVCQKNMPLLFSEWGLIVIPLIITIPFILLIPFLLLRRKTA